MSDILVIRNRECIVGLEDGRTLSEVMQAEVALKWLFAEWTGGIGVAFGFVVVDKEIDCGSEVGGCDAVPVEL